MKHAFTILEIAIVLVVIGILAGGIIAGRSMIRASELNSIVTDFTRYATAANAFQTRYSALPGDMPNATGFWGDNAAACPDGSINDGTPGTCNGDGNGKIDWATPPGTTSESFQFWNQLVLAGLMSGKYSGIGGPTGATGNAIIGTNVPSSRLINSCFNAGTYNGGNASNFTLDYGNMLSVGTVNAYDCSNPNMDPQDAASIDAKLDDGNPAQGQVIGIFPLTCTTAANSSDYDAAYKLTSSAIVCALRYRNAF